MIAAGTEQSPVPVEKVPRQRGSSGSAGARNFASAKTLKEGVFQGWSYGDSDSSVLRHSCPTVPSAELSLSHPSHPSSVSVPSSCH